MLDDLPTVILPEAEAPPARAPRPLVSEEDLDERSESQNDVEGVEVAEVGSEEAAPDLERGADLESTTSPDEVDSAAAEPDLERSVTLGELEVEATVPEGSASEGPTSDGESRDEPEPVLEAEPLAAPTEAATVQKDALDTEGRANTRLDVPTVPVQAERDGDRGDPGSEEEPEGKRRWSLFRRGGSR
jgi:hypothetical protein